MSVKSMSSDKFNWSIALVNLKISITTIGFLLKYALVTIPTHESTFISEGVAFKFDTRVLLFLWLGVMWTAGIVLSSFCKIMSFHNAKINILLLLNRLN